MQNGSEYNKKTEKIKQNFEKFNTKQTKRFTKKNKNRDASTKSADPSIYHSTLHA